MAALWLLEREDVCVCVFSCCFFFFLHFFFNCVSFTNDEMHSVSVCVNVEFR